jgi:hypothetical protein
MAGAVDDCLLPHTPSVRVTQVVDLQMATQWRSLKCIQQDGEEQFIYIILPSQLPNLHSIPALAGMHSWCTCAANVALALVLEVTLLPFPVSRPAVMLAAHPPHP